MWDEGAKARPAGVARELMPALGERSYRHARHATSRHAAQAHLATQREEASHSSHQHCLFGGRLVAGIHTRQGAPAAGGEGWARAGCRLGLRISALRQHARRLAPCSPSHTRQLHPPHNTDVPEALRQLMRREVQCLAWGGGCAGRGSAAPPSASPTAAQFVLPLCLLLLLAASAARKSSWRLFLGLGDGGCAGSRHQVRPWCSPLLLSLCMCHRLLSLQRHASRAASNCAPRLALTRRPPPP